MINKSITVYRRVGGLYKGSKKDVRGIKRGCSRNRGLRFKDRGFYIGLYSRL